MVNMVSPYFFCEHLNAGKTLVDYHTGFIVTQEGDAMHFRTPTMSFDMRFDARAITHEETRLTVFHRGEQVAVINPWGYNLKTEVDA